MTLKLCAGYFATYATHVVLPTEIAELGRPSREYTKRRFFGCVPESYVRLLIRVPASANPLVLLSLCSQTVWEEGIVSSTLPEEVQTLFSNHPFRRPVCVIERFVETLSERCC